MVGAVYATVENSTPLPLKTQPTKPGFPEVGVTHIIGARQPVATNCLHRTSRAMQVTLSMDSTPPLPIDAPAQARISVAVDPVALITTECITVTSAMRKHARWAQSSVAAILGGSSSGYGSVQAAIPPPSPRSPAFSRGGKGGKVDGKDGEARIEAPGSDAGLANRWGLRGKRGKSIQVGVLNLGFLFDCTKGGGDEASCSCFPSWRFWKETGLRRKASDLLGDVVRMVFNGRK